MITRRIEENSYDLEVVVKGGDERKMNVKKRFINT